MLFWNPEGIDLRFGLRFICTALLIIMITLIVPGLRFGGRYIILAEALLSALLASFFRKLIGTRLSHRKRSFLTAIGIVITLFIGKTLFYGVNLPLLGIIILYFGAVLLELVLPARSENGVRQSEEGENYWKH
jgi:hypothetical protein